MIIFMEYVPLYEKDKFDLLTEYDRQTTNMVKNWCTRITNWEEKIMEYGKDLKGDWQLWRNK